MKSYSSSVHFPFAFLSMVFILCAVPGIAGKQTLFDSQYTIAQEGIDMDRPALIPQPQSIIWTTGNFQLNKCRFIIARSKNLKNEAALLQQELAKIGKKLSIKYYSYKTSYNCIELKQVADSSRKEEAYKLQVNKEHLILTSGTSHGIFNGIQTLLQLINSTGEIPCCDIKDAPAFLWRGYLADVARNYQSVDLLKQQIDVMARYKLNVFHFHVTDDIAWRLQIKQYPQLTAAENMIRDKGQFYSIATVKELIEYCKARYITFVPEVDMPGHSAAFTRAMGIDMQSDQGLKIIENIVRELCATYQVPYFHIGADEVKIHNPQFLIEVVSLVEQLGKKVIGWKPGGNYDQSVIRQIWQDDISNKNEAVNGDSVKSIDSWHLYLNHMDPLNSVVSIFNRQIGKRLTGDSRMMGGEICMWTDRRLEHQDDIFYQNPVYPAMVTFAERSWRGGGTQGILMNIGPGFSERAKDFEAFEERLIAHKHKYFAYLPFPYVRQSHIHWKMFGPFNNHGQLSDSFWPEQEGLNPEDSAGSLYATGATIWLRHFFGPGLASWLPEPVENTTWYAFTRFWSNSDTILHLWIGTKDISRSHPDDSPPEGGWDYLQTKFWINGQLITPPQWVHAGKKGAWEVPLVDEGFTYRPPQAVPVKKGWNNVMVKAPVGSFKAKAWYLPIKWMFTFVPVHKTNGVNYDADEIKFSAN